MRIDGLQTDFEQECFEKGILSVAGMDEVGRGALAGPVVAAAYVLRATTRIVDGVNDSKLLVAKTRAIREYELLRAGGDWGIGIATVGEINRLGIITSTLLAMKRALLKLPEYPEVLLIDGRFRPALTTWFPANTLWSEKADSRYYGVAAASILAKEFRDRHMVSLAKKYPEFQFQRNKGYGTLLHRKALLRFGLTRQHRTHFCTSFQS